MNILVIGSGGREHALVWKLAQSPKVKKIYCAPGNGGIAELAECLSISPENIPGLVEFAKKANIGLTVVGPELPLSRGIVDEFEKNDLRIFGPKKNAAILEFSKGFTKDICQKYKIPTAKFFSTLDMEEARQKLEKRKRFPVVIKADGLAAGKGVVIAANSKEAVAAAGAMLVDERFGEAGRKIIVEDFLEGEEATYMIATDGKDFIPLASSQDHKRISDGDKGLNTGGMGAYSPAPILTDEVEEKVIRKIVRPLLNGMQKEGRPYRGILYVGLMIDKGEPSLVEFNCRFGDPEAQVVLARMETDLVDLILAVLDGKGGEFKPRFSKTAVCVVMSEKGYPGEYDRGNVITGIKEAEKEGALVFHSGTKFEEGEFLTSGGRVLGVTATGNDLKGAMAKAYRAVKKIKWEGAHYRKDIGKKGLK